MWFVEKFAHLSAPFCTHQQHSKRWKSYRNPYRKDDSFRSLLLFQATREAALAADLIMAASKWDKNCKNHKLEPIVVQLVKRRRAATSLD